MRGSKNMPWNSASPCPASADRPAAACGRSRSAPRSGVLTRSFLSVAEITLPTSSRSGKKTSNSAMPASMSLASTRRRQLVVGLDQHFAGRMSTTSAAAKAPSRSLGATSTSVDLAPSGSPCRAPCVILRARRCTISSPALVIAVRELEADQSRRETLPVELLVACIVTSVDLVERPQDFGVGLQPQRAQEDGAQELALAVDADVQQVLVCRTRTPPRAAVGDDLAEEVACGCWRSRRRRRASGATG